MSRKAYITTVKEVLKTSDPFPQLVKLTEGSKNIGEALEKLNDAKVPVCAATIRTTIRAEIAKGKTSRVRKSSDLYHTLTAGRGRPVGSLGAKKLTEPVGAVPVAASA